MVWKPQQDLCEPGTLTCNGAWAAAEVEGFILLLQTCFFSVLNAAREDLSAEGSLPARAKVELVWAECIPA